MSIQFKIVIASSQHTDTGALCFMWRMRLMMASENGRNM
jgi:hypothetical protein